jgi:hypothetical protein
MRLPRSSYSVTHEHRLKVRCKFLDETPRPDSVEDIKRDLSEFFDGKASHQRKLMQRVAEIHDAGEAVHHLLAIPGRPSLQIAGLFVTRDVHPAAYDMRLAYPCIPLSKLHETLKWDHDQISRHRVVAD